MLRAVREQAQLTTVVEVDLTEVLRLRDCAADVFAVREGVPLTTLPFVVAAPTSSIDLSLASGKEIPIEERDSAEISRGLGRQTAPDDVAFYNPAFDVTPAGLITAIVTERRVVRPPEHPAAVLNEEEA